MRAKPVSIQGQGFWMRGGIKRTFTSPAQAALTAVRPLCPKTVRVPDSPAVSQTRSCPRQSRCVPSPFVSQTVPWCPKPVRVPDSPVVSQARSCPRQSRSVPSPFVSQSVPLYPKPVRVPVSPAVSQALSLSQSVPLCPKPVRVPVSPAVSQALSRPSPVMSQIHCVPIIVRVWLVDQSTLGHWDTKHQGHNRTRTIYMCVRMYSKPAIKL